MPAFRTIQARYTLFLVLFILLLSVPWSASANWSPRNCGIPKNR